MDPDRPAEELMTLINKLQEALTLEPKFQPHLDLPQTKNDSGEISSGIRDGSANILRCLKVWYDLPSDVLFVAINLIDRFLSKMMARSKHMACISVAAFQLAAKQVSATLKPDEVIQVPDPRDLISISQCKCTLGDLTRMEGIISTKLGAEPNTLPITSLTFVRLLHSIFAAAAQEAGISEAYSRAISKSSIWIQLEIITCDYTCCNHRAVEIALVLMCATLQLSITEFPEIARLVGLAFELRRMCQITDESFCICHEAIVKILGRYNAHTQMPYRQRLDWRLSHRTMRLLRPTNKLVSTLPTIDEHGQLQLPKRPRFVSDSDTDSDACISSSLTWEDCDEEEVPPSTFPCDLA